MEAAVFSTRELLAEREKFDPDGWREFLRVPTLRTGIYRLPRGAEDRQSPHREDEVYYVVSGRGRLAVETAEGRREFPCEPGAVLFVKAGLSHRFEGVTEELVLLVVFARHQSGTLEVRSEN